MRIITHGWQFGATTYLEHEDLWLCINGTDVTTNDTEKLHRDA